MWTSYAFLQCGLGTWAICLRSVLRHTYQEGSNKLIIREGDETNADRVAGRVNQCQGSRLIIFMPVFLLNINNERLLSARAQSRCSTYIKPFYVHNIPMIQHCSLSPSSYLWGTDRLSNLPKVTPLIKDSRARIQTQAVWLQLRAVLYYLLLRFSHSPPQSHH